MCCNSAGYSQAAEPSKGKSLQKNYSKTIQIEGQKSPEMLKKSTQVKTNEEKAATEKKSEMPSAQQNDEAEVAPASNQILLNPEHWFNRYTDNRNIFLSNDGLLSKKEQAELGSIVSESKSYISNSFEFSYINLRHHRNTSEAGKYLQEAIKISGMNNSLLLPEIAWIAERLGETSKRNQALSQYELAGNISKIQSEMAVWSLNVVESGSLIITNGEFDTYPLWLNQQKKNVHVISLAMLEDAAWLSKSLTNWNSNLVIPQNLNTAEALIDYLLKQNGKPVYLSLSIRSNILSEYTNKLYPIGPLAKLSNTSWNSTNALITFYFDPSLQQFLKTGINQNDPFIKSISNLLPGIHLLRTQLQSQKDPRAVKAAGIYQQIQTITGKSIRQ